MTIQGAKELFTQLDGTNSKSTILKPLMWFISICIGGIIGLAEAKVSEWLIIILAIALGIAVLLFFFTYIYCLFKDKDALRSEKFTIQKMAIEKGIYGDDLIGIQKVSSQEAKALPQKNTDQEEEGGFAK